MKKVISIVTLSLFIAMSASAQIPESAVAHGLKGKVKSLTRTGSMTYIQEGKLVTSVNENDYLFDRNGKVLEIHSRTSFNGVKDSIRGSEYIVVFVYNESGLLTSEISTNVGESKPFKVISYTYDDKGLEVTQLHKSFYSSESTAMLYKTVYDAKGQKAELISLASESDGSFKEREKWQYKYDGSGREIERYYYDYDTKRYWKDQSVVYARSTYKESEKYLYHTDGSIYKKMVYAYADDGDLIGVESFSNGKPTGTTKYTYTDKDRAGNYCKTNISPAYGSGSSSNIIDVITYY